MTCDHTVWFDSISGARAVSYESRSSVFLWSVERQTLSDKSQLTAEELLTAATIGQVRTTGHAARSANCLGDCMDEVGWRRGCASG